MRGYSAPALPSYEPSSGPERNPVRYPAAGRQTHSDGPMFSSQGADKVWAESRKMVSIYPELHPEQIVQKAIEKLGVEIGEGERRLIVLATRFTQQGPAGRPNKIGGGPGAPGGPNRSNRYGHLLPGRGAP